MVNYNGVELTLQRRTLGHNGALADQANTTDMDAWPAIDELANRASPAVKVGTMKSRGNKNFSPAAAAGFCVGSLSAETSNFTGER